VSIMQTFEALKEKITNLETERTRLKAELDNLRKVAESRAITLENDLASMREEVKNMRQLLSPDSTGYVSVPLHSPVSVQAPSATAERVDLSVQPELNVPSTLPATGVQNPMESAPLIAETLSEDELKVVEVLLAHDGRYPQKSIRTESKLSWLQTNRVISRLVEKGVVAMEKNGLANNVVLSKDLKS
jgi:hypothetical protein